MSDFEKKLVSFLEKTNSEIGDDCAVFEKYAVTTDSLVEEVHFSLKFATPYQIGVKTACANLSDIASMGATPLYFLVSLSLPFENEEFALSFYKGLSAMLDKFSVKLIGGDTTGSKEGIFINGTAIGRKNRKFIFRNGAKPGDKIYLTGITGYSAIGFKMLKENLDVDSPFDAYALKKHLEPEPHVKEGEIIGKNSLANAMIDISDGLSKELYEICKKSETGAVLYPEWFKLPQCSHIDESQALHYFLHGGEEYVLLFTSDKPENEIRNKLPEAFAIGEISDESGVFLKDGCSLVKIDDLTYNHFDCRKGLY